MTSSVIFVFLTPVESSIYPPVTRRVREWRSGVIGLLRRSRSRIIASVRDPDTSTLDIGTIRICESVPDLTANVISPLSPVLLVTTSR